MGVEENQILKELRALAAHVQALDGRLTKHMEDEEVETHEITEKLAQLAKLIDAMPHNNGTPDLYGHRVDHDDFRRDRRTTDSLYGTIKTEVVKWGMEIAKLAIMGVVVLLASGHYAKVVEAVLK